MGLKFVGLNNSFKLGMIHKEPFVLLVQVCASVYFKTLENEMRALNFSRKMPAALFSNGFFMKPLFHSVSVYAAPADIAPKSFYSVRFFVCLSFLLLSLFGVSERATAQTTKNMLAEKPIVSEAQEARRSLLEPIEEEFEYEPLTWRDYNPERFPPEPPRTPWFKPSAGAKKLSIKHAVWFNAKNDAVILGGEVVLRKGQLEMLACLQKTKEHESIIAVDTQAFIVHAALLSLGAEPGSPVQFHPKYVAATGTEIEISLVWFDPQGNRHESSAKDWILNGNTDKKLSTNWVFAGSRFWKNPQTGKQTYEAESGDFICVSNFSSAMLDLPTESSKAAQQLLFVANTIQIPPKGTMLYMILKPILKEE